MGLPQLKLALGAFLMLFSGLTTVSPPSSYAEHPPPRPIVLPSRQTILDCVKNYTGFEESYNVEKIEAASLSQVSIPFLSSKLKDQTGIRVRFAPGKIKWPPPLNEAEDPYERHISVFLDAEAKGLIAVTIRLGVRPPDIQILPLAGQEEYLRGSDAIYESLPTIAPKVSFLQALRTVHVKSFARPLLAREIDGFYLNLTSASGRWETRPQWIIISRGLPPMPLPSLPGVKATFMRDLVDPISGKWIGGGTHGDPGF